MKKNLLFFGLIAVSLSIFAQGEVRWHDLEGSDLPDTVKIYRHANQHNDELTFDAYISNTNTTTDYYVALKRTFTQHIDGANDLLCYGASCVAGDGSLQEILTAASIQEKGSDVRTDDYIHFSPNENAGTAIIKYYIFAAADEASVFTEAPHDSVVVNFIIEPYQLTELYCNVDMAEVSGFDPDGSDHEVYVAISQGDDLLGIKKLNKVEGTVWYSNTASSAVDAGLNYTYKYSYGTREFDSEIGAYIYTVTEESVARNEIAVGTEEMEFNDVFDLLTSLKSDKFGMLTVYPNPFTNVVTINNIEDATKVEIRNVLGQTVYSTSLVSEKMNVSTGDLNPGMYFVIVSDANNNTFTQRVIKK